MISKVNGNALVVVYSLFLCNIMTDVKTTGKIPYVHYCFT